MYLPPSLPLARDSTWLQAVSSENHVFVCVEIEVSINQVHPTVNPPEFEAEEFELNSESSLLFYL